MPGEENLSELSDQLANSPDTSEVNPQGYTDDNGQAERLLPTSAQGDRTQNDPSQKNQLLAGKYKTPQELEKAYRSQNQGYRQLQTKQQQLERMLQNPKFQQMAANDPEMRQALQALGYELMEEESREDDRQQGGAWNGDTSSPDFKIAVLEHRNQLMWDRMEFQEELGRKLTAQEWADVRKQIQMAPRLSVKSAWKLTDHFDKEMEAKQQKALEAANRRPQVNRPKPVSQAIGGPKGPQGKSPLGLGEGEKGQFIQDLIDKAERS